MNNYLYELKNIKRQYGEHTALDIESLNLKQGIVTGVIGPNGSGKSTLLKTLAFAERPDQGLLSFMGIKADYNDIKLRRKIALLTQQPYLLKKTVFNNVAYGLRLRSDTQKLTSRVTQALKWVGLTPAANFMRRRPDTLSGGEAQRVALAARLILKPEVLLLDEPLASVDNASAELIKKASLMANREWGTGLIIASHDMAWIEDLAGDFINLYKGKLIGHGIKNLIPGPWLEMPEKGSQKNLNDQQSITTKDEVPKNAVAVLDPGHIRLHKPREKKNPGETLLKGQVIQLSYRSMDKSILIRIKIDGLVLDMKIPEDETDEHLPGPGEFINITFSSKNLSWIFD